jgi:hypothetical protein
MIGTRLPIQDQAVALGDDSEVADTAGDLVLGVDFEGRDVRDGCAFGWGHVFGLLE